MASIQLFPSLNRARSVVRLTLTLTTIIGFGVSSTVAAQSENSIAPADTAVISPGGVDMRSGAYLYTSTDAQIGNEESGLSLVRTRVRIDDSDDAQVNVAWFGPIQMTSNWHIRLYEHRVYLAPEEVTWGQYPRPVDYKHVANRYQGDFRYFIHMGSDIVTLEWRYNRRADGSIRSKAGVPPSRLFRGSAELAGSPSFTLRSPDGSVVTFNPLGQNCEGGPLPRCALASSITRPDGTQFTFSYSGALLTSVRSNRGYGLRFFYGSDPSAGPVHACLVNLAMASMPSTFPCNAAGQINVAYSFNNGFAVTKPDGRTERIVAGAWANGRRPISFFKGLESTPWLVNYEDGLDAVVRQELASGDVYTYDFVRATYADPPAYAGGSYTAPDSSVTRVNFNQIALPVRTLPSNMPPAPECLEDPRSCSSRPVIQVSSGPTSVVDALGRMSNFDYCDPMILTLTAIEGGGCLYDYLQSTTDPEGRKIKYRYLNRNAMVEEKRQIAKPGSGQSDIVETAQYGCGVMICDTAMTRYVDPKGGITDYDVSPVHRQVLSVTGPADANGIRPQTRYSYVQRNARDVSGAVLQPPVWVLASEEYCRTTAASGSDCVGGAADEVVTTYDYGPTTGPSNLLLRGVAVTADGQTLLTCYQYDSLGRRIAETKPQGTGATCP